MKTPYICAFHVERMKACESEAYRCWSEIMRRGVHAYAECRIEAAHIYLSSAFEIALLRHTCEKNGIFATSHVIKPAEFLLQLMLVELRFGEAANFLNRLSSTIGSDEGSANAVLTEFLAAQFERVEIAERSYMTSDGKRNCRQLNRQSLRLRNINQCEIS